MLPQQNRLQGNSTAVGNDSHIIINVFINDIKYVILGLWVWHVRVLIP